MSSSRRSDRPPDFGRDLPTTPDDVAALRAARRRPTGEARLDETRLRLLHPRALFPDSPGRGQRARGDAFALSDPEDGPPATLRPVRESDRGFLLRLYASTREEELRLVDWPPEQRAAFLEQQFTAQDRHYRERYEGASLDVVEIGGEPAGRLYVARWPREIRIMDVALLPEFRGRGLGTRLLRRLLDEAESARLPVSIHVERQNPALTLYRRLGFRLREDKGVYLLLERLPLSGR